jgi:anti-sigma regulatory factor (Ser/Thr protein kinase)
MTIVVDSRLDCVVLAVTLLRNFCEWVGAPSLDSRQIEVCVAEAMNNSVIHAYKLEAGRQLELCVSRNGCNIYCEIFDQGIAMDPLQLSRKRTQLPDLDSIALEDVPENGRGLSIILSVMDFVEYRSVNGTNCLSMRKQLRKPFEAHK